MNDTAVIIGTYNRAHLLRRSLIHYPHDVDIFVIDDGGTDDTFAVCKESDKSINYYFIESGEKKEWRDSASYLNKGIKTALNKGYKYIFITHPEIIPGKTTIESAKELATDKETWISCKGYYLTSEQQAHLKDDAQVKQLPNFYGQTKSAEFRGNPGFVPEAIEVAEVWGSWIFGGGTRRCGNTSAG
jgi:GT2 family glycosyltransferase